MRILQVFNNYLERGGEEVIVARIDEGLGDGVEVETLYLGGEEIGPGEAWKLVGVFLRMFRNREVLDEVRERVGKFRPDVVVLHNFMPCGSMALPGFLKKLGLPVVVYVHNYRPYSVNGFLWAGGRVSEAGMRKNFLPEILAGAWQKSRVKTAAYAVVLWWSHLAGTWRAVDRWLVISRFVGGVFERAGMAPERIRVLTHCHPGDPEALPFAPDGPPRLLYLGRLTEAKGVHVLLEAWRLLKAEGFEGVLDIAGSGELEGAVRAAAEELDGLHYHGFVTGEAKTGLLRACWALVVPSVWWEAFGLVTLDAYAVGRPVVASRAGGLSETVVEGETGWLCGAGDAAALAAEMRKAAADRGEAARRGRQGLDWLNENGNETDWRQRLVGLLQEVVNECRN